MLVFSSGEGKSADHIRAHHENHCSNLLKPQTLERTQPDFAVIGFAGCSSRPNLLLGLVLPSGLF